MSKEQAIELYNDLQRTMNQMMKNTATMEKGKEKPPLSPFPKVNVIKPPKKNTQIGWYLCGTFLAFRLFLSGAEVSLFEPQIAAAVVEKRENRFAPREVLNLSKEEVQLLKELDNRRIELEKRSYALIEREEALKRHEERMTVQAVELKKLIDTLHAANTATSKKGAEQIEQLAKVYSSMNPPEAAKLIEQLDIHIALGILRVMPDKRTAQILSLIKPERAIMVTKLLSGQ